MSVYSRPHNTTVAKRTSNESEISVFCISVTYCFVAIRETSIQSNSSTDGADVANNDTDRKLIKVILCTSVKYEILLLRLNNHSLNEGNGTTASRDDNSDTKIC